VSIAISHLSSNVQSPYTRHALRSAHHANEQLQESKLEHRSIATHTKYTPLPTAEDCGHGSLQTQASNQSLTNEGNIMLTRAVIQDGWRRLLKNKEEVAGLCPAASKDASRDS